MLSDGYGRRATRSGWFGPLRKIIECFLADRNMLREFRGRRTTRRLQVQQGSGAGRRFNGFNHDIFEIGEGVIRNSSSSEGSWRRLSKLLHTWWAGGVIRLTINGRGSLIPTFREDSHRGDRRSDAFAIRLTHPLTTHARRRPMGSMAWRGSIC